MKTALLLLLLAGTSPFFLRAQTRVTGNAHQDTIIRKKEIVYTTRQTPRGEKIRTRDITPRSDSWSFMASYGMSFGNQTTINIIPQVRYNPNVYISLGGGVNYIYYYSSHKDTKEKMNYMGVNLLVRFTPFPYLLFQVQPELLERWGKRNGEEVTGRLVPTLLAGGGFVIPAGPGSVNILFLFDIIQNDYTPYGKNLYYTIGYSFRF